MEKLNSPKVMVIMGILFMIGGFIWATYFDDDCKGIMPGIIFGVGLGAFSSNAYRLIKK